VAAATEQLQQLIQQGRARFDALSQRERWMVVAGGTALTLTLLYLAIIEPITLAHRKRVEALDSARALATQLETAAAAVNAAARRGGGATAGRGMSLLAAVDQSSKSGTLGKAPERLQPEGDKEVKLWFDDVPFDNLVRWLGELQTRYGITVQSLDIETQPGAGLVDARLSLVRNGS
jgi:general secretion pathway protein M